MQTREQIEQRIKEKELIERITEESIIQSWEKYHNYDYLFPHLLLEFMKQLPPFGNSNPTFIAAMQKYFNFLKTNYFKEGIVNDAYEEINLWLLLERFAANKEESVLQEIGRLLESLTVSGHPEVIPVNILFIRNVCLLNDQRVIDLFARYIPRIETVPEYLFNGYDLPEFLKKKFKKEAEKIVGFIETSKVDIEMLERHVITIQQAIRGKTRQREEKERISGIQRQRTTDSEFVSVDIILQDANRPYRPATCIEGLSDKIMLVARNVSLFSAIKHLTVPKVLGSIFNDGLFGNRTLEYLFVQYSPAAYDHYGDKASGDSNAICCGPFGIDPQIMLKNKLAVEIVIKMKNLDPTNPCIFYKQRDFGYFINKTRNVALGNMQLFFSHTNFPQEVNQFTTKFYLSFAQPSSDSNAGWECYASIENHKLIAYEFTNMYQILTLNFFRFIDNLRLCKDNAIAQEQIALIYEAISKLSSRELLTFLENVGKQLTDTMEFNFYGAYRLDFDAIETLNIYLGKENEEPATYAQRYTNHERIYSLNMQEFVRQLQNGEHDKLSEAQANIPTIFSSYRFIDYLLSNIHIDTNNQGIIGRLQALRASCIVPAWLSLYKAHIGRGNSSEVEAHRHESPEQQREYDKQFGLIISPKHLW